MRQTREAMQKTIDELRHQIEEMRDAARSAIYSFPPASDWPWSKDCQELCEAHLYYILGAKRGQKLPFSSMAVDEIKRLQSELAEVQLSFENCKKNYKYLQERYRNG